LEEKKKELKQGTEVVIGDHTPKSSGRHFRKPQKKNPRTTQG
jgi:hypothetical protein